MKEFYILTEKSTGQKFLYEKTDVVEKFTDLKNLNVEEITSFKTKEELYMLVYYFEDKIENANYHSLVSLPSELMEAMKTSGLSYEKIGEVLLKIGKVFDSL